MKVSGGNPDHEEGTPDHAQRSGEQGAVYEIRVKDHLDTYWIEWFDGWTITFLEDGEAVLRSEDVDQSALHGALNKIRDLNLRLLSVRRTDLPDSPSGENEAA